MDQKPKPLYDQHGNIVGWTGLPPVSGWDSHMNLVRADLNFYMGASLLQPITDRHTEGPEFERKQRQKIQRGE